MWLLHNISMRSQGTMLIRECPKSFKVINNICYVCLTERWQSLIIVTFRSLHAARSIYHCNHTLVCVCVWVCAKTHKIVAKGTGCGKLSHCQTVPRGFSILVLTLCLHAFECKTKLYIFPVSPRFQVQLKHSSHSELWKMQSPSMTGIVL